MAEHLPKFEVGDYRMVDVGTGLSVLAGSVVTVAIVKRILGPTADYIGAEMSLFAQQRVEIVQRIFASAANRLGPGLEEGGA